MQTATLERDTCTNVQYNRAMKQEPAVDTARIKKEMTRKGLRPGEIAEYSGVKYDTLYKILNLDRPRTSATEVAKLAAYFNCSVEYLMGMTDERAPVTLDISDELESLIEVARRLSGRRQRDLIAMARTYLENSEAFQQDPDRFMGDILDMIKEIAGEADRDRLIDLLDSYRASGDTPMLDNGTE